MVGGFGLRDKADCAEKIRWVEEIHLGTIQGHGCHCASLTVNDVFSQVVAGTMWWFHATSDKGELWSVCIY